MATVKYRSLHSFELVPELAVKEMLTEITSFVQCLLGKQTTLCITKRPLFSHPDHHKNFTTRLRNRPFFLYNLGKLLTCS